MTKIIWGNIYSDTDEPDNRGRWARNAIVGNFDKTFANDGFVGIYGIAWIERFEEKFSVNYKFPYTGSKYLFTTLEEAKAEVEKYFRRFVDNCK